MPEKLRRLGNSYLPLFILFFLAACANTETPKPTPTISPTRTPIRVEIYDPIPNIRPENNSQGVCATYNATRYFPGDFKGDLSIIPDPKYFEAFVLELPKSHEKSAEKVAIISPPSPDLSVHINFNGVEGFIRQKITNSCGITRIQEHVGRIADDVFVLNLKDRLIEQFQRFGQREQEALDRIHYFRRNSNFTQTQIFFAGP